MASSHTSLDAAALDRKARLAKLASLKRKQSSTDNHPEDPREVTHVDEKQNSTTDAFLSGRNYDLQTRGPKIGFENEPSANVPTLEKQADAVASTAAQQAAKDEEAAERGIDLFKLQPKKPNWDLKRDLAEKMKVLDVRTQNAIARLVRERIQNTQRNAVQKGHQVDPENIDQGEEVGIEGNVLVEGVHLREREEEQERRAKELEEEDGIS